MEAKGLALLKAVDEPLRKQSIVMTETSLRLLLLKLVIDQLLLLLDVFEHVVAFRQSNKVRKDL
jgi:hypothetical protein